MADDAEDVAASSDEASGEYGEFGAWLKDNIKEEAAKNTEWAGEDADFALELPEMEWEELEGLEVEGDNNNEA